MRDYKPPESPDKTFLSKMRSLALASAYETLKEEDPLFDIKIEANQKRLKEGQDFCFGMLYRIRDSMGREYIDMLINKEVTSL